MVTGRERVKLIVNIDHMNLRKNNIGVQYLDAYPEKRNIINIVPNANYIILHDKYKKIRALKTKLRSYTKLKKTFNFILTQKNSDRYLLKGIENIENIDVCHFFNTIYVNAKIPWGVTYETIVPNFEPFTDFHKGDVGNGNIKSLDGIKKYLEILSDDKCKFIIAISFCAFDIQKSMLNYFPEYKSRIEKKLHIIHPPQPLLLNQISEKEFISEKVNFMFIGSDLLGKGGGEIIRVFLKIQHKFSNFHLYIVGKFDLNSNNAKDFTSEDVVKFKDFIEGNKEIVTYYEYLDNDSVLKLIRKKIHVGLLPTRSDTYGYSILEFQAAGCPTISTNLRALAEINNDTIGWLIDVKTNKFGEPFHFNKQQLLDMSIEIEEGLEKHVVSILKNTNQVDVKKLKALQKIKRMHSVECYRDKIQDIYSEIR